MKSDRGTRSGFDLRIAYRKPTNLHFHVLHVSLGGNADNVFLEIPPGRAKFMSFPFRRTIAEEPFGITPISTT